MGMQFSPMYQPVSTKTIKADGDLNVSPYDITAYDGHFDTVEADEFVGGVGNFTSGVISGDMQVDGVISANGFISNTASTITVTPSTTTLSAVDTGQNMLILPPRLGYVYSGTVKATCRAAATSTVMCYVNGAYTPVSYNNSLYTPTDHTFTLPAGVEFAYFANVTNVYLPLLSYT